MRPSAGTMADHIKLVLGFGEVHQRVAGMFTGPTGILEEREDRGLSVGSAQASIYQIIRSDEDLLMLSVGVVVGL